MTLKPLVLAVKINFWRSISGHWRDVEQVMTRSFSKNGSQNGACSRRSPPAISGYSRMAHHWYRCGRELFGRHAARRRLLLLLVSQTSCPEI